MKFQKSVQRRITCGNVDNGQVVCFRRGLRRHIACSPWWRGLRFCKYEVGHMSALIYELQRAYRLVAAFHNFNSSYLLVENQSLTLGDFAGICIFGDFINIKPEGVPHVVKKGMS